MGDLIWTGKKYNMDDLYQVNWVTCDGKDRLEYFTTRARAQETWGDVCGQLDYVHIWIKPEDGVRAFLQHLPLNMVEIIKV